VFIEYLVSLSQVVAALRAQAPAHAYPGVAARYRCVYVSQYMHIYSQILALNACQVKSYSPYLPCVLTLTVFKQQSPAKR
jgi:hypothetical protein